MPRECSGCQLSLGRQQYSSNQWRKAASSSRCKECTSQAAHCPAVPAATGTCKTSQSDLTGGGVAVNTECQRDGLFECTAARQLHSTEPEPDSADVDEREPAVGSNSGGFPRESNGNIILKRGALDSPSRSHSMPAAQPEPYEKHSSRLLTCSID